MSISVEVARASGKWKRKGVPHKGWVCVGQEDLGSLDKICEMCESTEIRYVQYMQHNDYEDVLACGCVCAGHMEEDYVAAVERERVMKNTAARRKNWIKRKWKTSAKGNSILSANGFLVTSYLKQKTWGCSVRNEKTGEVYFSRRPHKTEESAKLAAFDQIVFLQTQTKTK